MSALILLKAYLVGFLATAPYGPAGILSIQKVIKNESVVPGIRIGAGCILADGIIVFCAMLFGSRLLQWIDLYQLPLTGLAAGLLIFYGAYTWQRYKKESIDLLKEKVPVKRGMSLTVFGFLFTIGHVGNWATIFAIVTVTKLVRPPMYDGITVMVCYALGGICMWATFLTAIHFLAGRLLREPRKFAQQIERFVAIAMIILGVGLSASAVWQAAT